MEKMLILNIKKVILIIRFNNRKVAGIVQRYCKIMLRKNGVKIIQQPIVMA